MLTNKINELNMMIGRKRGDSSLALLMEEEGYVLYSSGNHEKFNNEKTEWIYSASRSFQTVDVYYKMVSMYRRNAKNNTIIQKELP